MNSTLRPALVLFLALSLVTGLGYPLLVGSIASIAMPFQAGGSIAERDGKVVPTERRALQPSEPDGWLAVAHVRPTTGAMVFFDDLVGRRIDPGRRPLLDQAYAGARVVRALDKLTVSLDA